MRAISTRRDVEKLGEDSGGNSPIAHGALRVDAGRQDRDLGGVEHAVVVGRVARPGSHAIPRHGFSVQQLAFGEQKFVLGLFEEVVSPVLGSVTFSG